MTLIDRFRGKMVTLVAVILLPLPSSASVLCIAPGGHVAIEDINAACCAHSAMSPRSGNLPKGGFDEPGNCQDCTDLFMTPNGRGAILDSCIEVAPDLMAHATPIKHLPPPPLSARRSGTHKKIDAPPLGSCPAPLRC